MTNAAERSGRVLGRADCNVAVDGSGSLSFSGGALVRTGYACQAVVTLPFEPTATLSWLVTLNTLPLFPLPGGSSLGPMTILDGDTLTFSCTSGLVEGAEYEATLIGYRVALDDPNFQFLLPTGVPPTVAGSGSPPPNEVTVAGPLPLPVEVADQPIQIEQGPLVIVIETPPEGMKTVGYSFCLHAVGGTRPYTWSLPTGSLPTGLTLSTGGHVTGTTSAAGGSTAVFTVTDADGNTDTEAFGFVVLPLPSTYIEEIESTDGSITVTDPTGPTVDLATAGAYIKEITSIDGSVTVTDPTGPTVDLPTAGGGGALEYIAFNEDVNWTFPLGGWVAYETTPDLDVGTWLLTVQTNYLLNGTPSSVAAIRVIENSATATFVGPTQAGGGGPYSIDCDCLLTFTCIVKVAVKGTLDIQAQGNYRGELVGWTTVGGGPATGYTAVRVSPSAS